MRLTLLLALTAMFFSAQLPQWTHLSSVTGDLPSPGPSEQQTGSLVCDVDNDGVNDFFVVTLVVGPAVTLFLRGGDGWEKQTVEPDFLRIEAGGYLGPWTFWPGQVSIVMSCTACATTSESGGIWRRANRSASLS